MKFVSSNLHFTSVIIFGSIMPITADETTAAPITPLPSTASVPVSAPTSTCTGSTPGWVNVYGNGCDWYEQNDLPGCPYFGAYVGIDDSTGELIIGEPGSVGNGNCCYCFGTAVSKSEIIKVSNVFHTTLTNAQPSHCFVPFPGPISLSDILSNHIAISNHRNKSASYTISNIHFNVSSFFNILSNHVAISNHRNESASYTTYSLSNILSNHIAISNCTHTQTDLSMHWQHTQLD